MCLSPPKDNSAELARQREAQRAIAIKTGMGNIDSAFGAFDDDYFKGVQQSALDFYLPQLQDQYRDAHKGAVLSLSRSGNLSGSAGADTLARLKKEQEMARARVGDRALQFSQGARGDVENARSQLVAQLNASADPSAAASQAVNRAQLLSAPPVFDPLGDAFAKFTGSLANVAAAEKSGYRGLDTGLFALPRGGSASVIN